MAPNAMPREPVIHYHAIFGKAFKDAVRKDYLETNPMLKVDRPKKNSFHPNFYSKDEVQQLLEVSQDDPLHLCILITAYYGLRRSEVLGLKWDAIDFEANTLEVKHIVTQASIDGKKVLVQADRAKTKSSLRTLPLVPPIRDRLLELKGQQETYRRLCRSSYNPGYLGYLCVDEIGNIIRPNYVSEQFPKLLEKNGLRPIRFHDLRHSCASLLLANGVPMKQIQEWLGHSDFSTTANIYAHLDYASKLSSAQAMLEGLGYGNASA
jgi:integrase